MPHVQTPGLKIHYEEAGAGPNVFVLVHGNFGSWRWWKPLLEQLPPGFRAYAPDLRGCGDTMGDSSTEAYGIPTLADDLLAFVEALGLRRFHLVGHSLGGAVAVQFALDHPEKLRTLTLVTPAPATGLEAMREGSSASARILRKINPEHAPSMAVLQSSYRWHRALGTNRLMLRGAIARMMPSAALKRAEIESLLRDAARMKPVAVVGFLQALHRWDVAGELGGVRVRTQILAGAKDALVPAAALDETARLLPRGRLVIWPDVGHSPQVERPDEFVRLLQATARRSLRMRLRTWLWRRRSRKEARRAAPDAGPDGPRAAQPASVGEE